VNLVLLETQLGQYVPMIKDDAVQIQQVIVQAGTSRSEGTLRPSRLPLEPCLFPAQCGITARLFACSPTSYCAPTRSVPRSIKDALHYTVSDACAPCRRWRSILSGLVRQRQR
jgi:hypothetical protein